MPHPQANLATHLLGHATSLHDALHGLGRGFPGRHEHQRPRQVRIYMHAEHCHVQIPHLGVPCLQGGGSGLSQVGSPDGVVTGRRRGLHVAGQVSSQILLLQVAGSRKSAGHPGPPTSALPELSRPASAFSRSCFLRRQVKPAAALWPLSHRVRATCPPLRCCSAQGNPPQCAHHTQSSLGGFQFERHQHLKNMGV